MTKTVNVHEAKTHLSRLIEEALAGEEIVIAKAGKPKVRLTVIEAPRVYRTPWEGAGCMRGQIWIADDAFDPMPEEELALWYPDSVDPCGHLHSDLAAGETRGDLPPGEKDSG